MSDDGLFEVEVPEAPVTGPDPSQEILAAR